MAIKLKTITEALAFLDSFDGWGMVSDDEDLQVEQLMKLDLVDDYTPKYRKMYEDYLGSHIEWEHIEKDMNEKYNTTVLTELDYFDLKELASYYEY